MIILVGGSVAGFTAWWIFVTSLETRATEDDRLESILDWNRFYSSDAFAACGYAAANGRLGSTVDFYACTPVGRAARSGYFLIRNQDAVSEQLRRAPVIMVCSYTLADGKTWERRICKPAQFLDDERVKLE